MNTASILAQIDAEILKLQEAKALLNGAVSKKGPGRPKKSVAVAAPAKAKTTAKRVLSPEAKARIAAAQQARWAKVRKAAKKSAKAAATA